MDLGKCGKCGRPWSVSGTWDLQKVSCRCGIMLVDNRRGLRKEIPGEDIRKGLLNIHVGTNIFPRKKPFFRLKIGGD